MANPHETGGVLNPAVTRGPDGALYLLPRLVAQGNYSHIGVSRVVFNRHREPVGVERLGVVLEPEAPYELNAHTGGGVEDPRVTYIAARGLYVMTYTGFGAAGPRIAAAVSRDLVHWRRTGLVGFAPLHGIDMEAQDNKDAVLFPAPVPAPDGRLSLAPIHRPAFRAQDQDWAYAVTARQGRGERRPCMWISYAPLAAIAAGKHVVFGQHHLLAGPEQGWEHLKIGGGTPPVRVAQGWLVFYHGVSGRIVEGIDQQQEVCYSAGALLLDARDPRRVLQRSAESILEPRVAAERAGVVARVVLPNGGGRVGRRDPGRVSRDGRQPLDALPERERDVLRLRFLHGYTAPEIGQALGLTPGNVRILQLPPPQVEAIGASPSTSCCEASRPGNSLALATDVIPGSREDRPTSRRAPVCAETGKQVAMEAVIASTGRIQPPIAPNRHVQPTRLGTLERILT